MEVLDIISKVISILSGAFALFVVVSKPFRSWLLGAKKEEEREKEKADVRNKTYTCMLRSMITGVYYKYRDTKKIPEYEFENLEQLYKQYKMLGGNSFVEKIWSEIQNWTVIR